MIFRSIPPGAGGGTPITGRDSAWAMSWSTLRTRGRDVRRYVHGLEGWVIAALAQFGVCARRAEGRIGIWTDTRDGHEAKIGAIGVRIKKWVTMHGFAVNIDPDLAHFGGIVPCGIREYPVTSLAELGIGADMADFDAALHRSFHAFLDDLSPHGQADAEFPAMRSIHEG